jgi:hypothetical protein
MDHIENTTSNSSAIGACMSVGANTLLSHCLAMDMCMEPFPSNSLSLLASQFWLAADVTQYVSLKWKLHTHINISELVWQA